MSLGPVTVALALAACGRLDFDAEPAAPPDAADALACSWAPVPTLVGPPVALAALSELAYESDPTLSADELTLFFQRDGEILSATRATRTSPFGAAAPVAALAGVPGRHSGFVLDRDGLGGTLARDPAADTDIVRVTRATLAAAFADGVPVAELATPAHEFNPRASADGLALLFVRWQVVGEPTSSDLMVARRADVTAPWGAIEAASFSAAGVIEAGATFVGDDRTVLATIDDDLYLATRADAASPFAPPVRVEALASASFDGLPWISADGCEIFFVSGRDQPDGSWDLFRAEVTP